jgi:hypothetical protein
MNEAIRIAIEKGGYKVGGEQYAVNLGVYIKDLQTGTRARIVLDPEFWFALGKGLGNKEVMMCAHSRCESKLCEYGGYKDPKQMFDSYMETLWHEENIQKLFWKKLLVETTYSV